VLRDGVAGLEVMSAEGTRQYYAQLAETEHLGERQRRNQAEQAPSWSTSLSEVQVELQQHAAAAHARNALNPRYNGEDAKARLAAHG
jgi:hypothetical protein